MKSKNILVPILSITLILVGLILVSSFGLSRPKQNSEWITFSGDLAGSQEVVGCCPNAGPFPIYTMTLSDNFPEEFRGEHTGHIFLNRFGRNMPWAYKVQFWWGGENEYFIEIRGGEVHLEKRTKIITVTFTQEDTCWIWDPVGVEIIIFIEFTLIRDPQGR
ncbi:MAG: hypothetical protein KAW66_09505 [Candidatus Lokiarchaeota archaeon]|nr:hypothetical protein [Candidatus Lokiarchaeota archaeon]